MLLPVVSPGIRFRTVAKCVFSKKCAGISIASNYSRIFLFNCFLIILFSRAFHWLYLYRSGLGLGSLELVKTILRNITRICAAMYRNEKRIFSNDSILIDFFPFIDRFYSIFPSCRPSSSRNNHLEQSSRELNHSRTNVSPSPSLSLFLYVRHRVGRKVWIGFKQGLVVPSGREFGRRWEKEEGEQLVTRSDGFFANRNTSEFLFGSL